MLALILLLPVCSAVEEAIATMFSSSHYSSSGGNAGGTVSFELSSGDIIVSYTLTGLTPGIHGFHIHQFGDITTTADLSTIGAHFVPECKPGDIETDAAACNSLSLGASCSFVGLSGSTFTGTCIRDNIVDALVCTSQAENPCADDQTHGYPPSNVRQPGDMGNITVASDGTSSGTINLGSTKLSLSDPWRSVIGRVVVVHENPDDGSQPYGSAGLPQAYGVIGIQPPTSGTNEAIAPTLPVVEFVSCVFTNENNAAGSNVNGSMMLQKVFGTSTVIGEGHFSGLAGVQSFHFHTYGDISSDASNVGPIYTFPNAEISSITDGSISVSFENAGNLTSIIGRSLTVHNGASTSTPTIAWSVCGIASETACVGSGCDSSSTFTPSPTPLSLDGLTTETTIIVSSVGILIAVAVVLTMVGIIIGAFVFYRKHPEAFTLHTDSEHDDAFGSGIAMGEPPALPKRETSSA